MNSVADPSANTSHQQFELEGVFAGIFRDVWGKRRLVLRVTGEEEVYLRIPKPLRHELRDRVQPGQRVRVMGRSEAGERSPLVVSVRLEGEPEESACVLCPIEVCTKKNCWRNGGRELWAELEHEIAAAGLEGRVRLVGVDCLDRCKRAPNANAVGLEFERCRPGDGERMVKALRAGGGGSLARK